MVKKETVLYRGRVLKIDTVHSKEAQVFATCRLVDFGRIETISIDDLMSLPEELRKFNAFCVCLKLSGIVATGSNDPEKWTMKAKEALQEMLKNREIVMEQKGRQAFDEIAKVVKVPAGLYYREKITKGPFDPLEIRKIDVKDLLVSRGLALVPRRLSQSSPNEVWPKPRLPSNDEFLGVVTNIDSEGQVYIQNEIGENVTYGMRKILTAIHSDFPRREVNLKWLPGCALIAQYSDGSWNRGMVTEVNRSDGLICVLFVDYGQTCSIDPNQHNCHKMALMFEQVPIQVLRCKLENIVPKEGKYSPDFIEKISKEIVGKKVTVQITRKNVNTFPLPVIVHLIEGEIKLKGNLARIFIMEGAAQKMSTPQEWFEGKDRLNEIAAHIHPMAEPEAEGKDGLHNLLEEIIFCSKIFPEMPQIPVSIDEFFPVVYSYAAAQFLFVRPAPMKSCNEQDSTMSDIRFRLHNLHEDFSEMQEEIQNETENCLTESEAKVVPVVYNPFLVKWEDDMWYRCMIYDFKEDSALVSVYFVDYGNTQDCHVSDLRYMPLKHMKVPRQTFHVDKTEKIDKIVKNGNLEDFLTGAELAVKKCQGKGDKVELYYYENKQWQQL